MADILLIHGASHGAWCWSKLIPHLKEMGHSARAIDLPSHGDDPTPPGTVTIADYVDACTDALGDDTILVGHSLGGLTITLAAAQHPDRIRALVYLCAFVPPPGQPFAEIRKDAVTSDLQTAVSVDREAGISTILTETAPPVFYQDCRPEDVAYALPRLSPQPIAVLTEPLMFTPPELPRHYIRCTEDRVVKPAYQTAVSSDWPKDNVHEIACGHSPFFSHPDRLAGILDKIANT
ncbi:MAG: alpha/beta fold hydrolase [Silicimonas sp.]|nr:alpha/beta fold hydrolase [Silicimonas sp.]